MNISFKEDETVVVGEPVKTDKQDADKKSDKD
jgi:hypothetical protein